MLPFYNYLLNKQTLERKVKRKICRVVTVNPLIGSEIFTRDSEGRISCNK